MTSARNPFEHSSSAIWPGNAAKGLLIRRLQRELLLADRQIQVLDLGCGDGQGWGIFLDQNPAVSLTLWDTNCARMQSALKNLRELGAVAVDSIAGMNSSFDAVTSFSVLEHVRPGERVDYLRNAYELLRPGGLLLMTYDEGHFAYLSRLAHGSPVKDVVLEAGQEIVSCLARKSRYFRQSRVKTEDIKDELVRIGFSIESSISTNFASLKFAASKIANSEITPFTRLWTDFEESFADTHSSFSNNRGWLSTNFVAVKKLT